MCSWLFLLIGATPQRRTIQRIVLALEGNYPPEDSLVVRRRTWLISSRVWRTKAPGGTRVRVCTDDCRRPAQFRRPGGADGGPGGSSGSTAHRGPRAGARGGGEPGRLADSRRRRRGLGAR